MQQPPTELQHGPENYGGARNQQKHKNQEQKTPLLNSTLKSLGNYTAKQEISTELGAAAWVCNVLRTEPESAIASLECIRDVALDPANCTDFS